MADGHSPRTSSSFEERSREIPRYLYGLGILFVTFSIQAFGGWWFNSLALWADTAHLATDIVAYFIAITVALLVRRSNGGGNTIRWKGTVWSVLLLATSLGIVLAEVPGRFEHPPAIDGAGMLGIAVIGAFGNYVQHRIVSQGEPHGTTESLALHILTDLVSSFGVIAAGMLLILTGWPGWDPIATIGITAWTLWRSYKLLAGQGHDHHGHAHHH